MKSKLLVFAACSLLISMAACNNGETNQTATGTDTTTSATTTEATTPVSDTAYVELEANDQMQFSTNAITVKEGQTVVLTLKHVGTATKQAMGHNFVLLKPGTDFADFGQAAAAAADNDYIPQSKADVIVAHTKLLAGGESDTITFPAPPKGDYPFMCSFPGHWATMKGIFTVE
jgi:azurin